MGRYDYLYVNPFVRITASWPNAVVSALNELYDIANDIAEHTLTVYALQSVPVDIMPDQSDVRDLGADYRRWRAVFADYGYFYYDLYVQGKRVIKDEDPININQFFDPALAQLYYTIAKAIEDAGDPQLIAGLVDSILTNTTTMLSILQALYRDGVRLYDLASQARLAFGQVLTSYLPQAIDSSSLLADTDHLLKYQTAIDLVKGYASQTTASFHVLPNITGSVDERDLGIFSLEGTYQYASPTTYSASGVPRLPGSPFDTVLAVGLAQGDTATLRVPARCPAKGWCAVRLYLYTPSSDVQLTIGAVGLPDGASISHSTAYLVPNAWAMVEVVLPGDGDSGLPALLVTLTNSGSSSTTVYIGPIFTTYIGDEEKDVPILCLDGVKLPVSSSSQAFVNAVAPSLAGTLPVASLAVDAQLASDGTNTTTVNAQLEGLTLLSASTTASTPASSSTEVPVLDLSDSLFHKLTITSTSAGSGYLQRICIRIASRRDELTRQEWASATIQAGGTYSYSPPTGYHISQAGLMLQAGANGPLTAYGISPDGTQDLVCQAPAGQTMPCTVDGRYVQLRIVNGDTSNQATAYIRAVLSRALILV